MWPMSMSVNIRGSTSYKVPPIYVIIRDQTRWWHQMDKLLVEVLLLWLSSRCSSSFFWRVPSAETKCWRPIARRWIVFWAKRSGRKRRLQGSSDWWVFLNSADQAGVERPVHFQAFFACIIIIIIIITITITIIIIIIIIIIIRHCWIPIIVGTCFVASTALHLIHTWLCVIFLRLPNQNQFFVLASIMWKATNSGQFITTSAEVTSTGGLVREAPQMVVKDL